MKLKKSLCLPYAGQPSGIDPSHGLLYAGQIRYIVRAAVKCIQHSRVLVIFFYKREDALSGPPHFALFLCKQDYITLEIKDEVKKWRTAALERLLPDGIASVSAMYSQRERQCIIRYLHADTDDAFLAIQRTQNQIMERRLKERIRKREQKIADRMKAIPAPPKGIDRWVEKNALPAYLFYTYSRRKETDGHCSTCGHDVRVTGARHNQTGFCPHCHRAVTYKAYGRSKRLFDHTTYLYLQKISDAELLLRVCKVFRLFDQPQSPRIQKWESLRLFIRPHEQPEIYHRGREGLLTPWKPGLHPQYSFWNINFENITKGYLYPGTLPAALQGTPWAYSHLQTYALCHREVDPGAYLSAFENHPALAYLTELRLFTLVEELSIPGPHQNSAVNLTGKNLREVLGVEKQDVPLLRELDVSSAALSVFRQLKARNSRPDKDFLRWVQENRLGKEDILKALTYLPQLPLMHYIQKQFASLRQIWTCYYHPYSAPQSVLVLYLDYLSMAKKIGRNLKNPVYLKPRDLQSAHDEAARHLRNLQSEWNSRRIRELYTLYYEKYHYQDKTFTILPPSSADEIVQEGKALCHCVANYVERMAKKQTVILFLRRLEAPDEPYYTVEVRQGKIRQVRGYGNADPTPAVSRFLSGWEKRKPSAPVNAAA